MGEKFLGSSRPAMTKKFKVGQLVIVPRLFELLNDYSGIVFTSDTNKEYVGIIIQVLDFEDLQLRYDYVVYVNGTEIVFFENELEEFKVKK